MFLVIPSAKQAWPKRADCWSPATPAIGKPPGSAVAPSAVRASTPDDGLTGRYLVALGRGAVRDQLQALRRLGVTDTATSSDFSTSSARSAPEDRPLLLEHLGVAVLPDGSIAVCDTYNGAVRRYDPVTEQVSTLASGVAEPSGAVVVEGELVVVAPEQVVGQRPHAKRAS